MNIVIITQDDPLYITETIHALIKKCNDNYSISACVVLDASPFGKKERFLKKALKTLYIFGFKFFIYYTFDWIMKKTFRLSLTKILNKYKIPKISLDKSINDPQSLEIIASYSPDLILSVAGNEIFKMPLIKLAPKGCLNLHTGLLPLQRFDAYFWALKNGKLGLEYLYFL